MSQWWYSGTEKDKQKRKQEVCNQLVQLNTLKDVLSKFSQIKKMFASADKDNDGKLSVAEWRDMLIQAGAPADQ